MWALAARAPGSMEVIGVQRGHAGDDQVAALSAIFAMATESTDAVDDVGTLEELFR